jgi:hypothetical protein
MLLIQKQHNIFGSNEFSIYFATIDVAVCTKILIKQDSSNATENQGSFYWYG